MLLAHYFQHSANEGNHTVAKTIGEVFSKSVLASLSPSRVSLRAPRRDKFSSGSPVELLHMPRITCPCTLLYMKTFLNFNDFDVPNNKACKLLWSNVIYTLLFLELQGGVFRSVLLTTILFTIFISPIYTLFPT
jgi:hypothetical protein